MENLELTMYADTVKYAGDYIFIKPFCDYFGIEYDNQCRFINRDPILKKSAGKNPDKLLFGDERSRVTLTKRGFIRWIQLINPQIVQVNLRDKLYQYQSFIFDYLYGNLEKKEQIKVKFQRLQKLRRLYGLIGNEIQLCEREIRQLNSEYFQIEISFGKRISRQQTLS